ncbi:MAG: glycosyltransferase [Chloroflexi bacterium]|nr:glycosyltransferase [Chloroflexota bacterium]
MSRFARDRRVFFIEEPLFRDEAGEAPDDATLALRESDGVIVGQPICRDPGPGAGSRLDAMYARLASQLVQGQGLDHYTLWFYTPMLLPAAERLAPSLVVYDAMDELSLFKGAPPELVPRERELLRMADVVFTGGVSLGQAKALLHPNVHAVPSGVDVDHYRQALDPATRVPDDLKLLPRPRIGFFGVIDERADLSLLAAVADSHPDWSFVMIGPVLKIDPAELPRRPNIYYLGQKQYRDLPGYVKGFDVCMMPFALNDATRYISPTKTLEYMAVHKPIVSTPVADVVGSYREAVHIAATTEEFVASVERALAEPDSDRAARIEREARILASSTWDAIVRRMGERMREAEAARAVGRTASNDAARRDTALADAPRLGQASAVTTDMATIGARPPG